MCIGFDASRMLAERTESHVAMGQAKVRRTLRSRLLEQHPYCIFCGGQTPSDTVEHLPPRALFLNKQRPHGLEFASCWACNNGTSHADLVASFLARVMPISDEVTYANEFEALMRNINQRVPGLLEEMGMSRASMKLPSKGLPPEARETLLKVDGPLMTRHMQMFSVKLGQALHFEDTSRIVPPEGGIFTRWYSNVDQLRGELPQEFLAQMPPGQTLRQGKVSVEDQFGYTSWVADDGSIGSHFATFGLSFAVLALVALDRSRFTDHAKFGENRHFAPGEILNPRKG